MTLTSPGFKASANFVLQDFLALPNTDAQHCFMCGYWFMTLYNTTRVDKTVYAYRLIAGDERIDVIRHLLGAAGRFRRSVRSFRVESLQ